MSLTAEVKLGKKYTIYLPKTIVQATGIKEGDRMLLKAEGQTLTVEILRNPLELAVKGKKFTSITPQQIERISREEQLKHIEGST